MPSDVKTIRIPIRKPKSPIRFVMKAFFPASAAESFSKLPHLDFLDVGWQGDVVKLRKHLPNTFLNIRLSPVEIINQSVEEIQQTIRHLVADSGNPHLTGVCCINMDEKVVDEKVTAIFETIETIRKEYAGKQQLS